MSRWQDNAVQYPRLIAEMEAAGFFDTTGPAGPLLEALCASMDLEPGDVAELVGRAQADWDRAVAATASTWQGWHVEWAIQVEPEEADTPAEAAAAAWAAMRAEGSIANVFAVTGPDGVAVEVDLSEVSS